MGHTQAHPSQLEASPPTKMLRRLASSILQSQRSFSSAPLYNSVTEVFDRIKHVASPAVVKEVGAIFHLRSATRATWSTSRTELATSPLGPPLLRRMLMSRLTLPTCSSCSTGRLNP